ncbi:unnamed protein product [Discula destructiva]
MYFQLGNYSSRSVPSTFLVETPSTFQVPTGPTTPPYSGAQLPPGPLMSTAQAMVGNKTWFDLANTVLQQQQAPTNETVSTYLDLICHYMPLRNADYFATISAFGGICGLLASKPGIVSGYSRGVTFTEGLAEVVREFFKIFNVPYIGQAALNTGAFFANKYLLNTANELASAEVSYVYSYDGIQTDPVIPKVSVGALVAITILLVLQAVAVILLLLYIYSTRVWTKSLDAMAIASLGAQLSELDIPDRREGAAGHLGVVVMSEARRTRLWKMEGLTDPKIVHRYEGPSQNEVELTSLPPPYAPRTQHPSAGEAGTREQGLQHMERPATAPPYTPSEIDQAVDRQVFGQSGTEESTEDAHLPPVSSASPVP